MPKQTLSQATRKSVQAANLDQLDNFGSSIDDLTATSELSIIETVIGDFIKKVKQNLDSKEMIVTGKIEDITIEKSGTDINILAPNYLAYQDKGINGTEAHLYDTPYKYTTKMPPFQPILDWVLARGLAEGQAARGMAFAIQRKIFTEGMKPRNVYSNEIPALANSLAEHIADFTVKNILDNIGKNEQSTGNN